MQVKINKKSKLSFRKIASDLKVNLRDNESKGKTKQPSRKWLFLSVVLSIIVIYLSISCYSLISKKGPFDETLNNFLKNTVAYAVIDHSQLYPQVAPFNSFMQDSNFTGKNIINGFNQYLNETKLSFTEHIQPLFKDELIYMALPANSDNLLPFLVVLENKDNSAKISQILDILESEMKKDFSISEYMYRQNEVSVLNSLTVSYRNFYYIQMKNYLFISNSKESIEKIVDSVINSD